MEPNDEIEPLALNAALKLKFKPEKVRLSTCWHIASGRNAWHSTWSSVFYPRAFALSADSLKEKCERLRVQGSVFSIISAPLALISTDDICLGITPVNEKSPSSYAYLLDATLRGDFIDYFRAIDTNWLCLFKIPDDTDKQAGFKPNDWKSISYGGGYRLGWTARQHRNYDGFMSLFKAFESLSAKV
jgi:hypothetical protein